MECHYDQPKHDRRGARRLTDYLLDLRADGHLLGVTVPALDAPRTAHLTQARESVRA